MPNFYYNRGRYKEQRHFRWNLKRGAIGYETHSINFNWGGCHCCRAETANGFKAPVIFTADPYAQGMNEKWSEAYSHNNVRPLKRKQPNSLTYADVAATEPSTDDLPKPRDIKGHTRQTGETFTKFWSYSLNDYFLARGFAVVYSSGIGTKDSDGFRTTGTKAETLSATAVIEWLHGDRVAFTNRFDQLAIKAWWSNGNIGMTGKLASFLVASSSELRLPGQLLTSQRYCS